MASSAHSIKRQSMAFRYRVCLQIFHPDADPREIMRRMGRPAMVSWARGDARITPKGTPLGGIRSQTYCAFNIGGGEDGELAFCLRRAVDELKGSQSFFHELRSTGGSLNFLVSWWTGERGENFNVALLADMAELGIDLGIEPLSGN